MSDKMAQLGLSFHLVVLLSFCLMKFRLSFPFSCEGTASERILVMVFYGQVRRRAAEFLSLLLPRRKKKTTESTVMLLIWALFFESLSEDGFESFFLPLD